MRSLLDLWLHRNEHIKIRARQWSHMRVQSVLGQQRNAASKSVFTKPFLKSLMGLHPT